MKKRFLVFGVFLLCFVLPFGATAFAYSNIVAFGDSLSDNGNADGYGLVVSSNGPVWVDYLATSLGVGLLDMAYGGARTDYHPATDSSNWGFGWQIDQYINTVNSGTVDSDALFTIWIGGNDLLNISGDPTPVITNAVTNISQGINDLVNAGAQNVLVLNMPNLGLTPLMNGENLAFGPPFSDNPDGGTWLSGTFNGVLDGAIAPFRSTINLMEADSYALMTEFIADGLFDNDTNMLQYAGSTTDSYLFWDAIHPTTLAHEMIADEVLNIVAPVPLPAAVWLFASGLIGLVGIRRKYNK
jgi:phospholipase/lecithinase/hemolysin